ncbi:LysR family transcriptional regulator [Shewanella surugensis]|uniref:LysR family transcriptional regulator n=1 Tax=Shewanella surugensis TaxID=212020 RepID=A0ABT0LED1_9GAMM|nr:LysR family transcriptional regulator [Shewanella surugensis]MCL1126062.1 LysR family transcriptional regulator [Shewanella surugensis]
MIDLNRIQMFVQVVEQGSFTKAANALGVTKATVSRKIAELESDVGTQLLFRTTRALKLTETGACYFNRVQRILLDLHDAENILSANQEVIKGNLNIACPIELGQLFLAPILTQFLSNFPEMTINTELTNRKVDAVNEEIDILFHIAENKDPRLTSYALFHTTKRLMASPTYLAKHGTPKTPADLVEHQAILLQSPDNSVEWQLFNGKQWINITPKAQLTVNNITLAREAAIEGLGITSLVDKIAHQALKDNLLIPVLDDFPMNQALIILSHPQGAYLPKKYRAFIEFLYEEFNHRWEEELIDVPDYIALAKAN